MAEKIEVKDLYKIFGNSPEKALSMAKEGVSKGDILKQTGNTLGVDSASFSIQEGEVFVVMGLSGSGKSTLVRLFNRLIEPTSGQVSIDGRDIVQMTQKELIKLRRNDVGMVFQSFALMPHLSVLDNAAFGLSISGYETAKAREMAMAALEKVGLDDYARSRPNELSGGMQQRVGLARALAHDPSVLLMDEAFSALDPLIRTDMQNELLRLQQQEARTIVFISHDLDEAMRIGDRVAIMQDGEIVQIGTPDEIVRNPANDYVQAFFRGVDVSQVFSAGDIASRGAMTIVARGDNLVDSALSRLEKNESDYAYVHDRDRRYRGVISLDSIKSVRDRGSGSLAEAFLDDVSPITADTPLSELLGPVAEARCPLPVVDAEGRYSGVISKGGLLRVMDRAS